MTDPTMSQSTAPSPPKSRQAKAAHSGRPPAAPGSEDDFVQRLMAYVCREVPDLTPERAQAVESAIRGEWGGERVYILRTAADRRLRLARRVLQLFNGRNATEVARELNIGRTTVYRVLKQGGAVDGDDDG